MKQYKITVNVRTPSKLKDVLWSFEKLLPFDVSITSSDIVEDRPPTNEHHGGYSDLNEDSDYKDIPERY